MSKPKTRWIVIFVILVALQLLALGYSSSPETGSTEGLDKSDTAWLLVATAMVLFMTPGLSFFYGGMVSVKNVISTMLQSFIALGVISLLWYLVGFSLAFGDSIGGFIGNPATFFAFHNVGTGVHPALSPTVPLMLFAFFQLKFAIITPALITGSFAERVKFTSYLIFMCLFSLLIYAPLAHRLGISTIKWELEDISFSVLYPKVYEEIVNLVKQRSPKREEFITGVIESIESDLKDNLV